MRGLDIGKWLHNAGSVMILLAYVILLGLPRVGADCAARIPHFEPLPWEWPKAELVQPGDLRADDGGRAQRLRVCRDSGGRMPRRGAHHRTIRAHLGAGDRRDVHPRHQHGAHFHRRAADQRDRADPADLPHSPSARRGAAGFAAQFGIALLLARAVASASLIFTGLTRLPMATGWDNLVPRWFTRLDPRRRTPVNSIYFVAALVMGLILLSLLGVREQEASQLLDARLDRALRHRLRGAVRAAALRQRRAAPPTARWLKVAVGRRAWSPAWSRC